MNPRLGLILLFEGDWRKANATIRNVTAFSAVVGILKNGDNDVTATYIDTLPAYVGNLLQSDTIGGKATIVPGSYRYFLSGTYGGKERTWFWDVLVLPKNLSLLNSQEISTEDYDPLIEEVVIYEGDNFAKEVVVPGANFTFVSGSLRMFSDDVTATYCAGAANASGDTLTTHNIGGLAPIPAGDYGYFLSATYANGEVKSTWFFHVKVLPKQGVL